MNVSQLHRASEIVGAMSEITDRTIPLMFVELYAREKKIKGHKCSTY